MVDVAPDVEWFLNIDASDDVMLDDVALYVDGVIWSTWTVGSPSFSRQETMGPYAAGESHTITVVAVDTSGNVAQWEDVVTATGAVADVTPPVVSVTVTQA
jgi:hypothetical protein